MSSEHWKESVWMGQVRIDRQANGAVVLQAPSHTMVSIESHSFCTCR